MSRDVNDPGARGVTFDELEAAYHEQALGLLDGGADLLLVETAFDTLNAKAALFAIEHAFDVRGVRRPVMASVTITDLSGRNLSGQTTAAFWISVSHAPLLSVGLNCALGPKEMRPHVEELSSLAPCFVSAYPNAGLPNAFGGFDETPGSMAEALGEWARAGFLNVVGGCCGTTPAHIRAIAAAVRGVPPRRRAERPAPVAVLRPRALRHPGGLELRERRASGRTSPARRGSRSSSAPASTPRRSRSRASRSRAGRRSSTSTWTRGSSTRRRRCARS